MDYYGFYDSSRSLRYYEHGNKCNLVYPNRVFLCLPLDLFVSSLFKKTQLSGISTTLVSTALSIAAQVCHGSSSGAVATASLFRPSPKFVLMGLVFGHFELDIRQGQVLVPLSANGSGKRITLEAITGLATVDES